MKLQRAAFVITALLSTTAFGQNGLPHVELQITPSSIILREQQLSDDEAVKAALADLAKQNPRPVIYLTGSAGVSFDRIGRVMEVLQAFGLQTYIIGHEAP